MIFFLNRMSNILDGFCQKGGMKATDYLGVSIEELLAEEEGEKSVDS